MATTSDGPSLSTDDLREQIRASLSGWSATVAYEGDGLNHVMSVVAPLLAAERARVVELDDMVDRRDDELTRIHRALVAHLGEDDAMSYASRVDLVARQLAARDAEIDSWRGCASRLEIERDGLRDALVRLEGCLSGDDDDEADSVSLRRAVAHARTVLARCQEAGRPVVQEAPWPGTAHTMPAFTGTDTLDAQEAPAPPYSGEHADDCQGCEHIPGAIHCTAGEAGEPPEPHRAEVS